MSSSFIGKIKYKKERVGVVEKNGITCVKYIKARRFRISKNVQYVILSVFILVVLGLGLKLMLYELASRPPAEETAEVGG